MNRSIGHGVAAMWLAVLAVGAPGGAVTAGPPASMSEQPDEMEAPTIDEARALQQAGEWDKAAGAWKRITAHEPENGTAWFNLGYCLHAGGHLEQAIEVHQKAATFDDYHGIALYNLGCAYALAGRPDAALEALAESQTAGFGVRGAAETDSDLDSLRDDPRFAELLAREQADPRAALRQAIGHLQRFIQQRAPQARRQVSGMVQHALGHARGMLAQLQEKLAGDERFAEIAGKLEQLLGSRGGGSGQPRVTGGGGAPPVAPAIEAALEDARSKQQAGEWDAAVAAYRTVIDQDAENVAAWFGLAYCTHMGGHYEKAIEAHRKAATFEPIKGIALYNLACACALTGRTEEAFKALEASREAGFDVAGSMEDDADLESLRDDPRFRELLAGPDGDDAE